MHPLRRRLLIRLLISLAVILAAGAYAFMNLSNPELNRGPAPSKAAEVHPFIPSNEDRQLLADATRLLNEQYQGLPVWTGSESRLLEVREKVVEANSAVRVRMIFLGGHKRYAVIGNATYTVGRTLPDGRTITGINRTAVHLEAGGQSSILTWNGPTTVKLVRPEKESSSSGDKDKEGGTASITKDEKTPAAGAAQDNKLKLDADQARQLMDQLKNIPGVVGTSPTTKTN